MADKINIKIDDNRTIRIPAGTEMTPRLLSSLIAKHKELVTKYYKPLDDAYKGRYKIFTLPKKPAWKPDNRIALNYAKYISDTFTGFFLGIPAKLTVNDEEGEAIKDYVEYLDSYNSQDMVNSELAKISSNLGTAYEMYYNDEDGEVGTLCLSPMEAFMVYDDSILGHEMFFVRYTKGADNIERGSYSDDSIVRHFELKGGIHWTDEETQHYFGGVPATEYPHNTERMSIYEDSLSAIDALNKAISEKANDIEYFSDAYLKIVGPKIGKDDTNYIRDTRVINLYKNPGSDDTVQLDAEFLAKPDADTSQEHLIDRLHTEIFQLSMVANISDESFGTASGVALKYKLHAMYNLFRTKERKFKAGFDRRYRLIFSSPIAKTHGVAAEDWVKVSATFTPNFPANVTEEADNAAKLSGIVSRETQLSLLSFVEDAGAELERLQEDEAALMNSTNSYGADLPEHDHSHEVNEDEQS